MNNSDLADAVAASNGLTRADAEAAAKGEEVSLSGFGKFKIKETAAREGRNPATGAVMQIPVGKKLGFTPAKAVKDRLNG